MPCEKARRQPRSFGKCSSTLPSALTFSSAFSRILDWPVPIPCRVKRHKARESYQDFLALWKDADPDIPLLKQARRSTKAFYKEKCHDCIMAKHHIWWCASKRLCLPGNMCPEFFHQSSGLVFILLESCRH